MIVMLYYVISYNIMLCYVILHYIILYYICIILYYVILYYNLYIYIYMCLGYTLQTTALKYFYFVFLLVVKHFPAGMPQFSWDLRSEICAYSAGIVRDCLSCGCFQLDPLGSRDPPHGAGHRNHEIPPIFPIQCEAPGHDS